jgi:hypothetical protein
MLNINRRNKLFTIETLNYTACMHIYAIGRASAAAVHDDLFVIELNCRGEGVYPSCATATKVTKLTR